MGLQAAILSFSTPPSCPSQPEAIHEPCPLVPVHPRAPPASHPPMLYAPLLSHPINGTSSVRPRGHPPSPEQKLRGLQCLCPHTQATGSRDTADRHRRKGDSGVGPEYPNLRECWPMAQSCHLQAGLLPSSLSSLPESDSLPSWKKISKHSLLWSLFLTRGHIRTRS